MSDATKAVFLSYASQDAEAAKKICDALRAAGVEVWFDQNELVGGDAWDAKIRKQIKECALLIPIISANTQARAEGYFRREWKLAVERTHDMADHVAFLVPIVIDDTKDAEAFVPEKFREVQWTRLLAGEANGAFCGRLASLLSHHEAGPKASGSVAIPGRPAVLRRERPVWRWAGALVAGAGVIAAILWWQPWRQKAVTLQPGSAGAPASGPATEARQLVARAWEQMSRVDCYRSQLEIADDLCRRAAELAPDAPDVWAAWSQVDSWFVYDNFDLSAARRDSAHTKAVRASNLDATSFEARLANACYLVRASPRNSAGGDGGEFAASAERSLRTLRQERPADPRVVWALGILLRNNHRYEEAVAVFDAMASLPGAAANAWNEKGWVYLRAGDWRSSATANDRSIALQPFWGNQLLRLYVVLSWSGDLDGAKAAIENMPASDLMEDVLAFTAIQVFWRRHEPDAMLRVLNAVPRVWFSAVNMVGPKHYWTGIAQTMAGNDAAAQVSWREALKLVDEHLDKEPTSPELLKWKALLLAKMGRREEASEAMRIASGFGAQAGIAYLIAVGDRSGALKDLEHVYATAGTTWAELHTPVYDSLRNEPRFQALFAQAEADPTRNPHAAARDATETAPAAKADEKSVAVLAFANLSDDKANEYFSDGISEELLNVLAKIPGLKVTARTSAFHFKGKDTPISEIARQLGVAYVVEGSVRKQGTKVRITAQLIKAADGFHVWSDTFTRELKDIFAVQDEIAGLIAQQLQIKMDLAPARREVNPEAYRLYLEGRQAWNQRTAEGLARADIAYRRALELEPKFARALSGLADVGATYQSGSGTRLAQREKIVALAEGAIALDPSLAEPHATLGSLEFLNWNFEAADRHFQRAFTLNPSYAWAHLWRGQSLMTQGWVEEAMAENQRALEADPLAPRIASNTALFFLLTGRPGDALASAERSLLLLPGEHQAQTWKTEALLLLGREAEALKIAREALAIDPSRRDFTYVLARAGNPQEVAAAVSAPDRRFMNQTRSLLAIGRVNEAFAGLEADARSSVYSFQFVLFHPAFDGIRKDPRFVKMLEALRMTEAHARAQAWRAAHPPEKVELKE